MNTANTHLAREMDRSSLSPGSTSGLALSLHDVHAGYHALDVLHGVSLEVRAGEVVGVLGRNGAGKTTIVRAITGLLPIRSGQLLLDGVDRTKRYNPRRAVASGVAIVPEGRRVFAGTSVDDNLLVGAWPRRATRQELLHDREELLDRYPILRGRRRSAAGSLSGGEAQILALAMALMAKPRLVVLDEPSLGLAPIMFARVLEEVVALRETGVSVLLVEQNVSRALRVVDRAYVIGLGTVRSQGTPGQIAADREFKETFLRGI
jgi:branched-chain amino acid transport system ATP-binding protein